jgi:hypothetical protein
MPLFIGAADAQRNRRRCNMGILVSLLFAAGAFVPVGGHHGVRVSSLEGAPLIELEAEGDIDATPAEVMAVLVDYEQHPRMIQHLAESRILSRGGSELTVYQHLKLPVISDRDFTLHVTWLGNTRVQFTIDNQRGPGGQKKLVRMSLMNGSWELTPIRDGAATHARYHVQLDFAGSVPRWMVRGGAAKDLPNLYEGVRHMVQARRLRAQTSF